MAITFFLGLVLIGCTCSCVILFLAINAGPACPLCGQDAILIQRLWLKRLLPLLEQRWCLNCGWEGLVRRIGYTRPHGRHSPRRAAQPELGES